MNEKTTYKLDKIFTTTYLLISASRETWLEVGDKEIFGHFKGKVPASDKSIRS
jgi:hypothetical protein